MHVVFMVEEGAEVSVWAGVQDAQAQMGVPGQQSGIREGVLL